MQSSGVAPLAIGILAFVASATVTPIGVDLNHGLTVNQAMAGNGHGNAGGSGSNGKGSASDTGQANGIGNGGVNHGAEASALGALNAAHASQQGLDNASPGSETGKIKTYQDDLANYLDCSSNCDSPLDAVGADLAAASNKLPISSDTVSKLNELVGEPTTQTQSDDIAAAANAAQ
jgi:hypothetical protein